MWGVTTEQAATAAPWIRPARVADATEIARIHVESWRAAYRGIVSDRYLDALDVTHRAVEWVPVLEAASERVVVAEREAVASPLIAPPLRGFFQLGKSRDRDLDEQMAELWLIYIEPQSWRRGLGRRLMQHACELARADGYRGLSLWTVRGREESNQFYLSQGFRADRESETPCWRDAPEVETRRYVRHSL